MGGGVGVVAGRRAGVAVACALLIAACSSSDEPGSDTTVAAPTTTSTEPAATTATSSTSTTALPTSTSSTTSVPPTSPPTTADPAVAVEAAVRAAVDLAIADFSACLLALPACDPSTLAATRADPLLSVNVDRINEWNSAGYAVIDRDQFRHVIESVELSPTLDEATVTVCFADGSKLVDPGAGPDGSDVIVDGTYASGREAWDMRLGADGVWRVQEAPLVGQTEETDVCPAG